jgi:uroporphyrinogen decarboxylase
VSGTDPAHAAAAQPSGSPSSASDNPFQNGHTQPGHTPPAHAKPGHGKPGHFGPGHPGLAGSAFLRACRRQPVPHTPVWFMRQAGRSLPEYRAIRSEVPMLASCMMPELVTEITMQPVRRYGVDAAILFSDIVVPLKAIGVELDIKPGIGPVIEHPIRDYAGLAQLRTPEPGDLQPIADAVRLLTAELGATPLIGFAGAPFTLASYLIEGGPSRSYEHTKAMMYGAPDLFEALLDRLADITGTFLKVQIEAGASAVQLFDSWVGTLAPATYRRQVQPASAKVFAAVSGYGVPKIHFGVGTGELLALMGDAGADVVGVDWRVPLDDAAKRVGPGKALQGNLDPSVLFAPEAAYTAATRQVLDDAKGLEGHVFNLGHGVGPTTDPGVLNRVVELVHETSAR